MSVIPRFGCIVTGQTIISGELFDPAGQTADVDRQKWEWAGRMPRARYTSTIRNQTPSFGPHHHLFSSKPLQLLFTG